VTVPPPQEFPPLFSKGLVVSSSGTGVENVNGAWFFRVFCEWITSRSSMNNQAFSKGNSCDRCVYKR